jgi:peptidoglycan/LPS O-acetylase OafA/YrhL
MDDPEDQELRQAQRRPRRNLLAVGLVLAVAAILVFVIFRPARPFIGGPGAYPSPTVSICTYGGQPNDQGKCPPPRPHSP